MDEKVSTENVSDDDVIERSTSETSTIDPGFVQVVEQPKPFEIKVDCRPRICYALSHNKVPHIRSISIRNVEGGVSGQLSIRVEMKWVAASVPPMAPQEVVIECPSLGRTAEINGESFRLDDSALVDLTERAPARVVITVTESAGLSQSHEVEVEVLARNQWLHDPDLFELTAAFIQPNHPTVNDVLKDASELLQRTTGSNSLEGYQSGPARVLEIGAAIFTAMQSRIDNYINPPAGSEREGQKLRPIDEVLEQRQGTCLDLACAYASCLAQAGLSPFVFLVHGHAFTGFSLDKSVLGMNAVERNFSTIISLIESGVVVAAETTKIASRESFLSAQQAVRAHMRESLPGCEICEALVAAGVMKEIPHLEAAINVTRCHREGILPLPAKIVRDGIITLVIDNGPALPPIIERRDEKTLKVLPNTVPARVQQWKNSLLDLSFRNTLLNYRPGKTGVELLVPEKRLGYIEDQLNAGRSIQVNPADEISAILRERGIRAAQSIHNDDRDQILANTSTIFGMNETGPFATRIRNLNSKAKTEEQDTGSNNLYITFGSLKWSDPRSDVSEVVSPIFMLPIRVSMKRGASHAVISADESAITNVNFCLIEALRVRRGLKLEWFSSDMSDESGINIDRGLQELRSEILDQRLTDQGFEVIENCSIGLLRFSKIRLWKDLNDHWETLAKNPIVNHFIEGMRGQAFQDPYDPNHEGVPPFGDADLLNPQPADGAQSRAVRRALSKQSFVLEGPPGTGKSQTITNLLANALATGKRVLFVAEKQAALEVVKERLEAVGLDPFCLDLHDKGSRPEDIKKQLREALDFQPTADMSKWEEVNKRFDQTARVLDGYRNRLHGKTANGNSYFDAYVRLLEIGEGPVASVTRKLFDVAVDRIGRWRETLAEIEATTLAAKPRLGHPWSFASQVSFESIDRTQLADTLGEIRRSQSAVDSSTEPLVKLVGEVPTLGDLVGLAAVAKVLEAGASLSIEGWKEAGEPTWVTRIDQQIQILSKSTSDWNRTAPSVPTDLITRDLSQTLSEVRAAADSFVLGRKGRLKKALGDLADLGGQAELEPHEIVRRVEALLSASEAFRGAKNELATFSGLPVPSGWKGTSEGEIGELGQRAALVSSAASYFRLGSEASVRALEVAVGSAKTEAESVHLVLSYVEAVSRLFSILGATDESISIWTDSGKFSAALRNSLDAWEREREDGTYRSLQRWLQLDAEIATLDDDSVQEFRRELKNGSISGEDALDAFDRALINVTLKVVGEDNDLDVFDHTVHNRRVAEFIALLREREVQLRSVIPTLLFSARTFNAASSSGTIGQLRTELNSKKRGARSVRGLLAKYPELIVNLTPCFLMSPDSIAKFLEPGKIKFDLVVFDEASQIPVASAVGALGRADSAIVVGDSRQMPPTAVAVAGTSSEEDEVSSRPDGEEEAVITDSESILDECLESGLDQEWLAWHYRSRDELLIKFSNDKYYEGRLSSFPSPWLSVPGCGIQYNRIHGQFDHGGKRTNEIEAEAIVAEVRRRANDPLTARVSMGIVTMNLEQRALIQEKLNRLNDPAVAQLVDSEDDQENLFVLNLESVQGRERDVIIFGTSFSARMGGGKMPLNFGPLTQKGGERRLNVAVTRARRQVVIFSSFDPEELSDAKSLGMTHLFEYLKLARAVSDGSRPDAASMSETGDDLHRTLVAQALRKRGLIVQSGIGLSSFKVDLAVTLPGFEDRWLLGVLLDGRVWASRPLVLDRDAMPTTVLRNLMGWKQIIRVWLPSWRSDSSEIVEDIVESAIRISQTPDAEPDPVPDPIRVDGGSQGEEDQDVSRSLPQGDSEELVALSLDHDVVNVHEGQRPFTDPGEVVVIGSVDELEALSPRAKTYLRDLVNAFGPMTMEKAIKTTARAFNLSAVREKRLAALRMLVDEELIVDTEFGPYVFPAECVADGDVLPTFNWFRNSTFDQRKISEIAPHEVANVMVALARAAFSISVDELSADVLRFFGYGRKGAEAENRAKALVEWAVREGYLSEDDGRLSARSVDGV